MRSNKKIKSIDKNFISGKSSEEYKFFNKIIDLGLKFFSGEIRDHKVLKHKSPEKFLSELKDTLPSKGINDEKIIDTLKEIGKYSISQSDLNYIAFPDSANSKHAMAGEIFSKFLNQNLIAFDRSATIATFIEIQLIEWLRELIGYDYKPTSKIKSLSEVGGMWTTGGHMSNHIAIMSALNQKYPEIKENGLTSLSVTPKIVLSGKISHYSYNSAMHHLGLGNSNIISAESNADFTTNLSSLEKILKDHIDSNDVFMVVAVAGNCRTACIDNIEKIAKICQKYNTWLHVDACHGGSLLFSNKLKKRDLKGIEHADSIALDPHKGMFVTYPSSYVMFKQRDNLVKFTRYPEQVRNGESWDLGYITPFFGSRGFESLKIWLMIKALGKQYLGDIVEKRDEDAQFVWKQIEDSQYFTNFHEMDFYRMAFVYYPKDIKSIVNQKELTVKQKLSVKSCIDKYTHKINQELYESGNVCLDEFKLHDIGNTIGLDIPAERYFVMSITVGNPLYTEETLSKSLSYLFEKAKHYHKNILKEINAIIFEGKEQQNLIKSTGPAGWN